MSNDFPNSAKKSKEIEEVLVRYLDEKTYRVHPVERVKLFRRLEAGTKQRAEDQEKLNDEEGVPDPVEGEG